MELFKGFDLFIRDIIRVDFAINLLDVSFFVLVAVH